MSEKTLAMIDAAVLKHVRELGQGVLTDWVVSFATAEPGANDVDITASYAVGPTTPVHSALGLLDAAAHEIKADGL